jgi:hypothetical protein
MFNEKRLTMKGSSEADNKQESNATHPTGTEKTTTSSPFDSDIATCYTVPNSGKRPHATARYHTQSNKKATRPLQHHKYCAVPSSQVPAPATRPKTRLLRQTNIKWPSKPPHSKRSHDEYGESTDLENNMITARTEVEKSPEEPPNTDDASLELADNSTALESSSQASTMSKADE